MKKKIILINLILIAVVYFTFDIAIYSYSIVKSFELNSRIWTFREHIKQSVINYFENKYISFDKFYEKKIKFRPDVGLQFQKKPIVVFGCSFAYGSKLEDNQTFSYKLSEYTKRPVYNRASPGWGVQDMLYQLRRKDFYSNIKEPEYVIYVYMQGHMDRLYSEVWMTDTQVFYKSTPHGLVENKWLSTYNPFYNFIVKGIRWCYYARKFRIEYEKRGFIESDWFFYVAKFLNQHFSESREEALNHWNHPKFIVLVYSETGSENWSAIEASGWTVVKAKDLTTENLNSLKYVISETNDHPSEAAWNLLVPSLVKKLDIN